MLLLQEMQRIRMQACGLFGPCSPQWGEESCLQIIRNQERTDQMPGEGTKQLGPGNGPWDQGSQEVLHGGEGRDEGVRWWRSGA